MKIRSKAVLSLTVGLSALFLVGGLFVLVGYAQVKDGASVRCGLTPDPNPTFTSASYHVEFSLVPFGWTCFWQEDDREPEQRYLPFLP